MYVTARRVEVPRATNEQRGPVHRCPLANEVGEMHLTLASGKQAILDRRSIWFSVCPS